MTKTLKLAVLCFILAPPFAAAQDLHPLMTSKYWVNVGLFAATRSFEAGAEGSIPGTKREIDFEGAFDVDDAPNLFMAEFGWQFSKNWGLGVQYFDTEREASAMLEETFEWEDDTYTAGIDIQAGTNISITRFFFSRHFWDGGPHSLRLGAGLHWLEIGAFVAGEATLNDFTTEFRKNSVSLSAPVPNLGAWYRYSPSDRWMLTARVDWLSASIDEYSGGIWNVSAGANYRLFKNLGAGINYQFFQLDGSIDGSNWSGSLKTTFRGPHIYINGFW